MAQLLDKTHDQVMTFPGTWESFKLVQQGLRESPINASIAVNYQGWKT
jgi:hypothetical protein